MKYLIAILLFLAVTLQAKEVKYYYTLSITTHTFNNDGDIVLSVVQHFDRDTFFIDNTYIIGRKASYTYHNKSLIGSKMTYLCKDCSIEVSTSEIVIYKFIPDTAIMTEVIKYKILHEGTLNVTEQ